MITIDSDEDGSESVGSEVILISDSEPEPENLYVDYEEDEQDRLGNQEVEEINKDVKGTFPLVTFGYTCLFQWLFLERKNLLLLIIC